MIKKSLLIVSVVAVLAFLAVEVGHARMKKFVVIDTATPASLREVPNGTSSLVKIPAGTKIEIKSERNVVTGRAVITWYEVNYKGKRGWISQYVTMGDVIIEDDTGRQTVVKQKGADGPRFLGFSNRLKEKFKKQALNDLAVTYFEYPEGRNDQISVRLTLDKYTTRENVEQIASSLARMYKIGTGYDGAVWVFVWHPYESTIFAEGYCQ